MSGPVHSSAWIRRGLKTELDCHTHWWHCWQPQLPRDQGVFVCWWQLEWHTALVSYCYTSLDNMRSFYSTQSFTVSKTAASSARVESIYYRFLKARCEREYKHTWQWNFHARGISLPQGYLPLCCFILPSTWLKATFGSNWLFPSPAVARPWKPSFPSPAALCPP